MTYQGSVETLVATQNSRLSRYATGILRGSGIDSDDVMQEVWLRAHKAHTSGSLPANPAPWLQVVTRNCAIDARRRAARQEALPQPARWAGSAAQDAERRADLRDLLEDLESLAPRQRTALVRHALDGVDHDQLALELGGSRQTSKSLVFRARRHLQRRADARSLPCAELRLALQHAREAGARAPAIAKLHLTQCPGCRAHQRGLHKPARGILAWPWLKAGLVLLAAGTVAGATVSVARQDVVEPWKDRSSPSWTLGPGTAFSRHHVTVAQEQRDRSVKLSLRCPAGYGLFQFDSGRPHPPYVIAHGAWLGWLGARQKTMLVMPRPPARLPASFDLRVVCLTRSRLNRLVSRDRGAQRRLTQNWGSAS